MPTDTWGENTGTDFTAVTEDCTLEGSSPDTNFGSAVDLVVKHAVAFPRFFRHALIRFDLTGLAGAQVQDARLRLWLANTGSGFINVDVYAQPQPWVESEATWNHFATGQPWSDEATHDRGSFLGNLPAGVTTGLYYDLASAALDQAIQAAAGSSLSLILMDDQSNDIFKGFSSSEGPDGQRPILEITYTVPDVVFDGSSVISVVPDAEMVVERSLVGDGAMSLVPTATVLVDRTLIGSSEIVLLPAGAFLNDAILQGQSSLSLIPAAAFVVGAPLEPTEQVTLVRRLRHEFTLERPNTIPITVVRP